MDTDMTQIQHKLETVIAWATHRAEKSKARLALALMGVVYLLRGVLDQLDVLESDRAEQEDVLAAARANVRRLELQLKDLHAAAGAPGRAGVTLENVRQVPLTHFMLFMLYAPLAGGATPGPGKILAIVALRRLTDMGLADAKNCVEAFPASPELTEHYRSFMETRGFAVGQGSHIFGDPEAVLGPSEMRQRYARYVGAVTEGTQLNAYGQWVSSTGKTLSVLKPEEFVGLLYHYTQVGEQRLVSSFQGTPMEPSLGPFLKVMQ